MNYEPRTKNHFTEEQIRRRISELGEWFHNMNLNGIQTAPYHFLHDYPAVKWERFSHAIPADLHGKSVLDIGCNAGFYSIEMKLRGAGRVLGIDSDPRYLEQARFAAEVCGVEIELLQLSVYDVAQLQTQFDIVIFMGVLYHLRHPLLALDLIHEHAARDILIFQSMLRGDEGIEQLEENYPFSETGIFLKPGFAKLHFIEKHYAGDSTNWWIPNQACAEAMLRSAGFRITAHPETEVYICRKEKIANSCGAVYPARQESGN